MMNWKEKLTMLPERMRGGVERYIEHGIPPGDFLTAVLCNDLCGAVGRADDENVKLLDVYVRYFYSHAPHQCWGSHERFRAWINHGGLNGR